MTPLTVHHRTAYRYRRAVDLWPHRLMLCPLSRAAQEFGAGSTDRRAGLKPTQPGKNEA
jgi:hypothetical protein